MRQITRRQFDAIMVLYLCALAWIIYTMLADPDPEKRRLSRLHVRYRAYQRLAERVGRIGLAAEKEYHEYVEQMRTI